MRQKNRHTKNLQVYVFWTGFMSTVISLVHVIIIAFKQ